MMVQLSDTLAVNVDNVESLTQPWPGAPVSMAMLTGEIFEFPDTDIKTILRKLDQLPVPIRLEYS